MEHWFISVGLALSNTSLNPVNHISDPELLENIDNESTDEAENEQTFIQSSCSSEVLVLKYNRLLEKFHRLHKQFLKIQRENETFKKKTLRKYIYWIW